MLDNLVDAKVEIVLPNYNSEKYLADTVDSIINQTFKNWKLTIVDGNSKDKTHNIINKYIK